MLFSLRFILLLHAIKVAESSGKLMIRFFTFKNPGSRIQTGSCCDNVHFCISSCEVFIRFCLTVQSQSSSCSLINFETPVLGDDSFTFSNSLGNGIRNPVVHSFDKWTEPFRVKITVLDDDGQNPLGIGRVADLISSDDFAIPTSPDVDDSKATPHGKVLHGYRSELAIQYRIFCDAGYFRPSCKELCVPRDNSTGHYTCDYNNSKRVCLPNWYGNNCTRFCRPHNDATGHFFCTSEGNITCHPHWYGPNCTRYCAPQDGATGHYTCDNNGEQVCLKYWYGRNCLIHCEMKHNFNCSATGERVCTDRYYGGNCSRYCHANERGNFRCLDNSTIVCIENYFGHNCSVYCKARNDSFASYSCSATGFKICNANWYGIDCTINCRNTTTSYCTKNGTKLCHKDWHGLNCSKYCISDKSTISRYHCDADGSIVCFSGWYGTDCSNFTGCIDDPTNSSRYFCDKHTGAKICRFGWMGKNCSFRIGSPDGIEPPPTVISSTYGTTADAFSKTSITSHPTVVSFSTELPLKHTAIFQKQIPIINASSAKRLVFPATVISSKSVSTFASSSKFHGIQSTRDQHWHTSAVRPLMTSTSHSTAWFKSKAISQTPQISDAAYEKTRVLYQNGRSSTLSLRMKEKTIVYSSEIDVVPSLIISSTPKTLLKHIASGKKHIRDIATIISPDRKAKSYASYKSIEISSAHQSNQGTTDAFQDLPSSAIDAGRAEMIATVVSSRIQQSSTPVTNDIYVTTHSKLDSGRKATLNRHDQTSVNATHSAKMKSSLTRASRNDSIDRPNIKNRERNKKLWLYVGIPVVVFSLIMTIVAAKTCRSGKERVSTSKVMAIKIHPASSDTEKRRFLRSKKIEEESVSILPLIWLQLNKRESLPGGDDVANFF